MSLIWLHLKRLFLRPYKRHLLLISKNSTNRQRFSTWITFPTFKYIFQLFTHLHATQRHPFCFRKVYSEKKCFFIFKPLKYFTNPSCNTVYFPTFYQFDERRLMCQIRNFRKHISPRGRTWTGTSRCNGTTYNDKMSIRVFIVCTFNKGTQCADGKTTLYFAFSAITTTATTIQGVLGLTEKRGVVWSSESDLRWNWNFKLELFWFKHFFLHWNFQFLFLGIISDSCRLENYIHIRLCNVINKKYCNANGHRITFNIGTQSVDGKPTLYIAAFSIITTKNNTGCFWVDGTTRVFRVPPVRKGDLSFYRFDKKILIFYFWKTICF